MQIGINLPPRHERLTSGVRRSKFNVTQGRTYICNRGGDIIHDPSTRADRDMQWAMELLSLKGDGGVAHSILTAPPRIADMRLADALVKLLIYQQVHFPQQCNLEWEYSWKSWRSSGMQEEKVSRFRISSARQGTMQCLIPSSIPAFVLTTSVAHSVTLYSRSITTPSSPKSNQPALTPSRQPGDPVYSRTAAVAAAFSSTFINGRSDRRSVAETTVVILNCPRHTI